MTKPYKSRRRIWSLLKKTKATHGKTLLGGGVENATPQGVEKATPSCTSSIKKYKDKRQNASPGMRLGEGLPGFLDDNGDMKTKDKRITNLVDKFVDFTIKNRLHLKKVGATRSGWSRKTLQAWYTSVGYVVEQVEGDYDLIHKVMDWYIGNWKEEWVPTCHTLNTFCEKYFEIEKAMRRAQQETEPESDELEKLPGRVKVTTDTGKVVWVYDEAVR